jgi:hypothetical protein
VAHVFEVAVKVANALVSKLEVVVGLPPSDSLGTIFNTNMLIFKLG